nr:AHH domain-containing protein [Pseudomonas sp. KB-10]
MKSLEGFQKHHIIPQSLENHPALKNADFKMHSNRNIIYLPTNETAHPTRTIHKGSHPGYNKSVRQQLDIIARVGEKNGWVEADYKKAVSGVLRNERAGLRNGRTMLNKNSIRAVRCGG